MMDFPVNCLRGIPNNDFLVGDGSVASHLFTFKDEDKRDDGWIEQSINWEDDNSALAFTLKQLNDKGEIQFKAGIAVLPRSELDHITKQPSVSGILAYERQPLEDNQYHGNILLKADTPKPTKKRIAATLATFVSYTVRRD